ncbi:hypothetical protein [Streptomyces sp. NPDC057438]|uniref:hypothetical protein n=1 Tax=Streptomyces sp. NPDC057438 TaxID=3346133 RepID=UPI00368A8219
MARHRFVLSLVPGRAHVPLPQHQRIIAAIVTEDPAVAEAAVRDHVDGVVEALRTREARQERAS